MFDIGFSELLVIGVAALLVLGPERLPKLARDVGRWVGRARRFIDHVRDEIDREVELSELRRLRDEIEARAREVSGEADSIVTSAEDAVRSTLDDVALPLPGASVPPAPVDAPVKPKRRAPRKEAAPLATPDAGAAPEAATASSKTGGPRGRKRTVTTST